MYSRNPVERFLSRAKANTAGHSYRDTLNVLNNGEAVAKCIFIRKRNGIL